MKKIESKIVDYKVVKKDVMVEPEDRDVIVKEVIKPITPASRPNALVGTTYRVKPSAPYPEHAVYITINDMVGEFGVRQPMEIFINSKDMSHYEWTVALTRIISFIFRLSLASESNILLANELKSVFSPSGGFYPGKGSCLPKGRPVPSLVAAIGTVIEQHLRNLSLMEEDIITSSNANSDVELDYSSDEALFDPLEDDSDRQSVGAAIVKMAQCPSCAELSYSKQGGCGTCLSCSFSDCG